MLPYYEKIVVTQGVTEVWRYEKLNVSSEREYHERTGENDEHNYRNRQRIRRNRIRQLVTMNFDENSKFVTLTFNDQMPFDITDVKACSRYFKNFVLRIKRRYPNFKYVAVIEFQDKNGRGAVHYHMICNLPYIKKSELESIWKGGFVKINRIDKVDNVGAYVVKYMTSDMDDKRLCGLNAYLHSHGLKEPLEISSWKYPNEWREVHDDLQKKSPSYSAKYESEIAGTVCYFQYNSKRK